MIFRKKQGFFRFFPEKNRKDFCAFFSGKKPPEYWTFLTQV